MPVPAPQPGQPGWMLGGRYRVVDRVGAGGMAEVFRAHDQLLARDVAVKVFRTHTDPNEVTGGVQRHEVELQTLARLSHPNLITLFDGSIGSDGEPAFLVMELINGPSLAAQIAHAPLTEPMARELAAQIAAALAYVHSQHMVHRDIKPANILLGSDGVAGEATGNPLRARLSDFGIVRLLGSEHLTSADLMVGTASYLAPEQARGAEVGPPADVYALGLVLIEALTGRRSFQGPALETALARLERSPEIPADLPQPWPALLQAMTAMDPQARPTAAEVSRTLRDGVAVPVVPAPPGAAVLAGDAVLAGGAPLAAAAGLAAAPHAGAAFADAGFADPVPSGPVGVTGPAGFTGPASFTGPAGGDAHPELATAFIATSVPPMPPPAEDEVVPYFEPLPAEAARAGRGPLIGALVAAAALITVLTAGGLLLVHQPSSKGSTNLPGQVVSTGSTRQPGSATPSRSATAVAPIGSLTSSRGGTSSAPSTSSSAPSSTPASSSTRPSSSAPATSSAPPSSSVPATSSPASSGSATSSGSSTATTSASPAGSGSTSAAPAGAGGSGPPSTPRLHG